MVKRLWEWSVVQAESMAETGIVTGLLAAPLLGVVTEEDADSAVVIDMARNILGNPYEEHLDEAGEEDDTPGEPTTEDEPSDPKGESAPLLSGPALAEGDPDDQGSTRGVLGVDQVGGGPVGDEENGDQKLG